MCAALAVGDDPLVGVVDAETPREDRSPDDDADGDGVGDADVPADEGVRAGARGDASGDERALADDVESALGDGATVVRGDLETVLAASPSLLVAAGEATLSAAARARVDVPVLPVGAATGIDAVARERLPEALEAALGGATTVRPRTVLDVDEPASDADGFRALFDVTLVTDDPARISEFGVRSREAPVAGFRADGVVVATPAGSHGYASDVGGPLLSSAVDAVVAAPIGPFVTRTRRWVLPPDDLAVTVERDEGDVALVVDDRRVGTVPVGSPVTVSASDALRTVVVPDDELASE